mmetsp:Transcript_28492/g.82092  ORF Transcript_28492/g.82092 Transcript_28492/m.82092 type:complete len:241 (+) Transcript_28492:521-1243(+)
MSFLWSRCMATRRMATSSGDRRRSKGSHTSSLSRYIDCPLVLVSLSRSFPSRGGRNDDDCSEGGPAMRSSILLSAATTLLRRILRCCERPQSVELKKPVTLRVMTDAQMEKATPQLTTSTVAKYLASLSSRGEKNVACIPMRMKAAMMDASRTLLNMFCQGCMSSWKVSTHSISITTTDSCRYASLGSRTGTRATTISRSRNTRAHHLREGFQFPKRNLHRVSKPSVVPCLCGVYDRRMR